MDTSRAYRSLSLVVAGAALLWTVGCAGPAPAPDQAQQDAVPSAPIPPVVVEDGASGSGGADGPGGIGTSCMSGLYLCDTG